MGPGPQGLQIRRFQVSPLHLSDFQFLGIGDGVVGGFSLWLDSHVVLRS